MSLINCPKCNMEFENNDKQKYTKKFCSRKCANSRIFSEETLNKKSISAKNSEKVKIANKNIGLRTIRVLKKCKWCENTWHATIKNTRTCCSRECRDKHCGGYRRGSGRSKHGYYKGIRCDSTYELVWVIYRLDHKLEVKRYEGAIIYNNRHMYFPDFLDDNTVIEIKGFLTDKTKETMKQKQEATENLGYKFKMLFKEDLQTEFDWVKTHYEYDKLEQLYDGYKPKFTLICKDCKKIYTNEKETMFCSRECCGRYRIKENKSLDKP